MTISLPCSKDLKYFSPSSLMQAMDCEIEFWFNRLQDTVVLPKFKQTKPMAVGSAFDSFVKAEIARRFRKNEDKTFLAKLLENVSLENADCIPLGHLYFEYYMKWGCLDALLAEGLTDIELEVNREIFSEIGGVPIFCKPDAALIKPIPVDWKVNGALSDSGQSPKKGYTRCVRNGYPRPPHLERLNLEDIDIKWAIQTCIYAWMLGCPLDSEMKVAIEQIAVRGEDVSIASFRTIIGLEFQKSIQETLQDKWTRFKNHEFEIPNPSKFLCEPFRTPKICTQFCPYYARVKEQGAL